MKIRRANMLERACFQLEQEAQMLRGIAKLTRGDTRALLFAAAQRLEEYAALQLEMLGACEQLGLTQSQQEVSLDRDRAIPDVDQYLFAGSTILNGSETGSEQGH